MLNVLFIDMNSYFASVEQQEQPRLRGRPVAVAPMLADTTCCIAASYEAKRFGIRTGTAVGLARRLCPDLHVVEARPALYVQYHHRIVEAIESCLPVDTVHSIDEMSCRLLGPERRPDHAERIARQIKQTLRGRIGPFVRCSIGVGPNRFIAKVATDLQKPDGLTVVLPQDLPHKLHSLGLTDLPGIAAAMRGRLRRCGIDTVEQLCALDKPQLRQAWGSVVGEYWWHWLRGHDLPELPTRRQTVSHSHILPPELRRDADARAVLIRLLHKAAARLRSLQYWAGRLDVRLSFMDHPKWSDQQTFELCQDTLTLLEAFEAVWARRPHSALTAKPLKVAVVLGDLVPDRSAPGPLFPQARNRLALAQVIDRLNRRFGSHTVYFGGMHGVLQAAPMRISFTSIPDPSLPV